eukprot:jgi/Tetstr1/445766/TSEL_033414.t1
MQACRLIASDYTAWTSHTVVVVDQSGSMRKTDVPGGATRSDAVWVTLALEFVAQQLQRDDGKPTDVFSLVAMNDTTTGTVPLRHQPLDWILFNGLIGLLRTSLPAQGGNYLPALASAEALLMSNTHGSCALVLCFLSDGKPSDKVPADADRHRAWWLRERSSPMEKLCLLATERVAQLASHFGRRLSVAMIGFAGPDESFQVLQAMAKVPGEYGSHGSFHASTLTPESLSTAFSSLSASLTATRTELSHIGSSAQRAVRSVMREARSLVDELKLNDSWHFYPAVQQGFNHTTWVGGEGWVSVPIESGVAGVAMQTKIFGEGAERMVRKFRLVGQDGTFMGEKLVAKESREVEDIKNADLKKFHQVFCVTQGRAAELAHAFNERLSRVPGVGASTPRISFLPCSVYMVRDTAYGRIGLLVEKMLDPVKYKKWNNNCGYVQGRPRHDQPEAATDFHSMLPGKSAHLDGFMARMPAPHANAAGGRTHSVAPPRSMLGAIGEEEEEGEGEEEEEDDLLEGHTSSDAIRDAPIDIRPDDMPQAFSHFTYVHSGRKMLVCDLQGVLTTTCSPPLFEFTDPVIHYKSSAGRKRVFGQTDHGAKGVTDFFKTHKCSPLCHMIQQQWVQGPGQHSSGKEM